MTWFNANYKKRQVVGVDVLGGSGSAATIDIAILVHPDWDWFWDEIRSDFNDVVVTNVFGVVQNYARAAGTNYATRTLTLQVDGFASPDDDSFNVLHLYFGYAAETTDRSVVVSITSAKTGHIFLERPHSRIVPSGNGGRAIDMPISSFSKMPDEEIDVFFMTSGFLGKRSTPYNDRDGFEAVEVVKVFSYDAAGNDATGRYDEAETRIGNNFIKARFIAGGDGTDYAASVEIVTTEKQTINSRAILRVKALLPE